MSKIDQLAVRPEWPHSVAVTSAVSGEGIEALIALLQAKVGLSPEFSNEGAGFTARERHLDALRQTQEALARALAANESTAQLDGGVLLAEDLRAAHDSLGLIIGRTTPDDLLGEIFSHFCIGK